MQQDILLAIIHITSQNDVESLEYSLINTIAELIPILSISLFKPVLEKSYGEVEKTLCLKMHDRLSSYHWSDEPAVLNANRYLQDCFQNAAMVELAKKEGNAELYFPIATKGKVLAALHIKCLEITEEQRYLLDSLTKIYSNYLNMLNESERDNLTTLLNRRAFDQHFDKLTSTQKKRQQVSLVACDGNEKRHLAKSSRVHLAILDIDFFKRVNDNFGHLYGDEILLLITKLMRDCFRSSDLLFRFGGEEFVVMLEPSTTPMALKTLERFRKKVENYNFPRVGRITVSIGFTAVTDENYSDAVVSRADQALYHAKQNGKNGTFCYEQLVEAGGLPPQNNTTGPIEIFRTPIHN